MAEEPPKVEIPENRTPEGMASENRLLKAYLAKYDALKFSVMAAAGSLEAFMRMTQNEWPADFEALKPLHMNLRAKIQETHITLTNALAKMREPTPGAKTAAPSDHATRKA